MSRSSLLSLFADFKRFESGRAVVYPYGYRHSSWTYGKLASRALLFANALKSRGIRTGDRVLLWGPNSAEWVAAFWGCLLIGAVVVPLDNGATLDFAASVARETSARLVIAARDKPVLDPAIPALNLEGLSDVSTTSCRLVMRGTPGQPAQNMLENVADQRLTRGHIAQILFTSGTTAEPRGVVLTHGNFLANLEPLEGGIDP